MAKKSGMGMFLGQSAVQYRHPVQAMKVVSSMISATRVMISCSDSDSGAMSTMFSSTCSRLLMPLNMMFACGNGQTAAPSGLGCPGGAL